MYEGTAVALFREGKTTVKIFLPNANTIQVDNYVVLFLAIWSLPINKDVIQASCSKPQKCRLYFIEKMDYVNG